MINHFLPGNNIFKHPLARGRNFVPRWKISGGDHCIYPVQRKRCRHINVFDHCMCLGTAYNHTMDQPRARFISTVVRFTRYLFDTIRPNRSCSYMGIILRFSHIVLQ